MTNQNEPVEPDVPAAEAEPTPEERLAVVTAERDELIGVASAIKDAGRGVIEMISDFEDLEDEFGILQAMLSA